MEDASSQERSRSNFRKRGLGTVSIPSAPATWAWVFLTSAFLALVISTLAFARYTQRVHATGVLVPSSGLLRISAPTDGVVKRVIVHQGEMALPNAPLAELGDDAVSKDYGVTQGVIANSLLKQVADLKQDITSQSTSANLKVGVLSRQLINQKTNLSKIDDQIRLQKEQIGVYGSMQQRLKGLLEKGYTSRYEIEQQQLARLSKEVDLRGLEKQRLEVMRDISDLQQKIAQVPIDEALAISAINNKIADIKSSLAQNDAKQARVISSPTGGLVTVVLAKSGQQVAAGTQLLALMPKDSTLQAQLFVPSEAIGAISPGQQVMLRYDAYPYQEFGQYLGIVSKVSHSALSPEDIQNASGVKPKGPVFLVTVNLDRQTASSQHSNFNLSPGIHLEAEILVQRRSLLSWLLMPYKPAIAGQDIR